MTEMAVWCRWISLALVDRASLSDALEIEETFRFIKQSYNLEDIRVMKHQRLKNLVVLVKAAAYFAATSLGQKMKLRILCEKLLIISQRFFGIPPFRFYALADGIKNILSQSQSPPQQSPPNLQMELLLGRRAPQLLLKQLLTKEGLFSDPTMKLLLFTEQKDTLDFLVGDGKDGRLLG